MKAVFNLSLKIIKVHLPKPFKKLSNYTLRKALFFLHLCEMADLHHYFNLHIKQGEFFVVVESKNSPVHTKKLSKVTVCGRNVHAYFFLFVTATYFLLENTGCSGSFKTHPWFKIDICTLICIYMTKTL